MTASTTFRVEKKPIILPLSSKLAGIKKSFNIVSSFLSATKNGEGDLVVMDIEVYSRREKMLKLREELLAAEEDRIRGRKGYTVDEASDMLDSIIREAKNVG